MIRWKKNCCKKFGNNRDLNCGILAVEESVSFSQLLKLKVVVSDT